MISLIEDRDRVEVGIAQALTVIDRIATTARVGGGFCGSGADDEIRAMLSHIERDAKDLEAALKPLIDAGGD